MPFDRPAETIRRVLTKVGVDPATRIEPHDQDPEYTSCRPEELPAYFRLYLVYFCHGGRWRPAYTDSWTAVSRLPWLSALALWPSGTTYGGGGRFVDNRTLILRNGKQARPHPDHVPRGLELVDGKADRHASAGEVDDADWSGFDHRRRLIFARAGKLYRRVAGRDREILDLNGRAPEPVAAPAWATRPLGHRRKNSA